MKKFLNKKMLIAFAGLLTGAFIYIGCQETKEIAGTGDAAQKVYVAPGTYDEVYEFMSGGFSGQLSVYGIPSGRLFKVIPVFSQDPEKAYGYSLGNGPIDTTATRECDSCRFLLKVPHCIRILFS